MDNTANRTHIWEHYFGKHSRNNCFCNRRKEDCMGVINNPINRRQKSFYFAKHKTGKHARKYNRWIKYTCIDPYLVKDTRNDKYPIDGCIRETITEREFIKGVCQCENCFDCGRRSVHRNV